VDDSRDKNHIPIENAGLSTLSKSARSTDQRGGLIKLQSQFGYTVVEVMIFLAVTALLFSLIVVTFSGQRGRTQFSTAARDVESRLQDIANDVSTGFYPSTGSFRCRESGGEPDIDSVATDQGTNQDCVYLGRVVHFNVGGDKGRYTVYSVVGLRQSGGEDAIDYNEAEPTTDLILSEQQTLPGGLEIGYVRSGGSNINGIGYLSTLGKLDASGASLESGSLGVNVISVIGGGSASTTESQMVSHINSINKIYVDTNQNPTDGVTICFDSTTSDQHALFATGGNDRQLTTDLEIGSGSC